MTASFLLSTAPVDRKCWYGIIEKDMDYNFEESVVGFAPIVEKIMDDKGLEFSQAFNKAFREIGEFDQDLYFTVKSGVKRIIKPWSRKPKQLSLRLR